MHEHTFPQSPEPRANLQARAIAALQYEERARLGFRSREDLRRHVPAGQLVAGYLGAVGVVCGAAALVYRPLLMALLGTLFGMAALIGGGAATSLGRKALVITAVCFFLGAIWAVSGERTFF